MRLTRHQLHDGEQIPRLYRIAYIDLCTQAAICYPIGWHLVMRLFRRIWEWSFVYSESRLETLVLEALVKQRAELSKIPCRKCQERDEVFATHFNNIPDKVLIGFQRLVPRMIESMKAKEKDML
jgi:hypothetical protein